MQDPGKPWLGMVNYQVPVYIVSPGMIFPIRSPSELERSFLFLGKPSPTKTRETHGQPVSAVWWNILISSIVQKGVISRQILLAAILHFPAEMHTNALSPSPSRYPTLSCVCPSEAVLTYLGIRIFGAPQRLHELFQEPHPRRKSRGLRKRLSLRPKLTTATAASISFCTSGISLIYSCGHRSIQYPTGPGT